VLYHAPALLVSGGKRWPCRVLDISLKGCLLDVPEDWPGSDGDAVQVDIPLDGGLRIGMAATLARRSGRQAGFLCRDIDLDSVCVLRRLVELNLGDSDLLERDFHSLVHPTA
jgi:hypothetical protein